MNDHGEAERKVLDAFWKAIFGFLLALEARANITLALFLGLYHEIGCDLRSLFLR